MALQKSVTKFGQEFASAYHRITNVDYYVNEYETIQSIEQAPDEDGNPTPPVEETVTVVEKRANITVRSYVTADAREALAQPFESEVYNFTPDWESTDNILVQGYAYLKTLEKFDGATDV
jgi:hypothetical protein